MFKLLWWLILLPFKIAGTIIAAILALTFIVSMVMLAAAILGA